MTTGPLGVTSDLLPMTIPAGHTDVVSVVCGAYGVLRRQQSKQGCV